jgi:diguanylate cyclase (GGDEF)-like protein
MQVSDIHDRLESAITKVQLLGSKVAVLFVDLDGFHGVIDQFGHSAGDHLLQSVANSLRCMVREGDMVGRCGDDQFLMVLDDVGGPEAAEVVARRIAQDLQRPVIYRAAQLHVGASIGIAMSPDHGTTPDCLLQAAEAAMNHVRNSGGNGFAFSGIAAVTPSSEPSTADTWRNVHVLRQGGNGR